MRHTYGWRLCFALIVLAGGDSYSGGGDHVPVLPGLTYHPEGNAIVLENGTRWYTQPQEIKKLFDPSRQNDTQASCILFRPRNFENDRLRVRVSCA